MSPFSLFTRNKTHVLLYHACIDPIELNKKENIHNISPQNFKKQLIWFKKNFDIISLENIDSKNKKSNKLVITFDDAYSSFYESCLPVLEDLEIPVTLFVNGAVAKGEKSWREKVRYLIKKELVEKFLYESNYLKTSESNFKNFYFLTKQKDINSKILNKEIDTFFKKNFIADKKSDYCISNVNELINHPLITYGNHSLNHFVLSSLSYEEQYEEIYENQLFLESLDLKISKYFSIPFGTLDDFNQETVEILKMLNFKGLLLSRNKVNSKIGKIDNFLYIERFMPKYSIWKTYPQLLKLYLKEIL